MAVLLRVGGDFGKQRLVAMLSMATFPFIGSVIVEALTATGSGHASCTIVMEFIEYLPFVFI